MDTIITILITVLYSVIYSILHLIVGHGFQLLVIRDNIPVKMF